MAFVLVVASWAAPEERKSYNVTTVSVVAPVTTTTKLVPTTTTVYDLRKLAPVVEAFEQWTSTTKPKAASGGGRGEGQSTVSRPAANNSQCQYADLIREIWTKDAEWAISIAWRESRCQANARHPEGASGLFQMMMPMHRGIFERVGCAARQWSDPRCNVMAAWSLYQGSGRRPWAL